LAFSAAVFVCLISPVLAAGYQALKAETLVGNLHEPNPNAGFGLTLLSDDLSYWMSFGDPSEAGHRVHQWWLEGRWFGPKVGFPPSDLVAIDPDMGRRVGTFFPHFWWRAGRDSTEGQAFVLDVSEHAVFSLPGLWGIDGRALYFGPTAGIGLNLTWWDGWRGNNTHIINTGKITAEAGWVLGASWRETLYGQGRATVHYDLFGLHQTNLNIVGTCGVFWGAFDRPISVEVEGEFNYGNDNIDIAVKSNWALRFIVSFRFGWVPPDSQSNDLFLDVVEEYERALWKQ